ncbi:MAG: polysaccharide deacetylase family protein [Elusimicrobiota bacterium]
MKSFFAIAILFISVIVVSAEDAAVELNLDASTDTVIDISSNSALREDFSYRMETFPYNQFFSSGTLFVVVSFDGCKELSRWQDILNFSKANDIKFTFFISAAYFVPEKEKALYYEPTNPVKEGYSRIGFGGTQEDVAKRKKYVLEAIESGNDVESHLCGHFDAKNWDESAWRIEFEEFNELCSFLPEPVHHIRFPLLSMNKYVYPVLAEFNFKSIMSVDEDEFDKFNRVTIQIPKGGQPVSFLEFPMGTVQEGNSKVMLMDYNFSVHDQRNKIPVSKIQKKMVDIYIQEANRCFTQNRPLLLSHHFSVTNSQDSYWKALKEVILNLKAIYPAKFITLSQLSEMCNPDNAVR